MPYTRSPTPSTIWRIPPDVQEARPEPGKVLAARKMLANV